MMVPMALHDQKCLTASPFYHLDLTNGMVPLMTLLASCDTDTNIMELHSQKNFYTLIQLSSTNKYNGVMTIPLESLDAGANANKSND